MALGLTALPAHLIFAGAVQTLAPVTDADGRLGLCNVLPGKAATGQGWSRLAYDSGARLNRWEFRWDRLEPKRNTWHFGDTDRAVKDSRRAGLDVVGILIGTPGWALSKGQRPGNGLPKGIYLRPDDSHNLWAAYVRMTAERYAGEVRYWEIWNEPDLQFFWMSSPGDFYRLLSVSYSVIKEVDPEAKVVMGGMVVPDMSFLRQVLDAARYDGSRPFDAVSWHAYGPARTLYTDLRRFHYLLGGRGFGHVPLWVTEDGFPSSNPNGEPRQAAYVLQTIAYAYAAGAKKVFVYRASDSSEPKTWGLLSNSGIPRMGYVAFQVAARYFAHTQAISYAPTSSVERFALYQTSRRVVLFWSHDLQNRKLHLAAGHPQANLIDWMGHEKVVVPAKGEFQPLAHGASYNRSVDPSGQVVGGPPSLLLEDNTEPAGLSYQAYGPSIGGFGRRMVVMNPRDSVTTVKVDAAGLPKRKTVLALAPQSVQAVDLDLLAGADYRGSFGLSSSAPVEAASVSGRSVHSVIFPANRWFLPMAKPGFEITNFSTVSARVTVLGYQASGHTLLRQHHNLKPYQSVSTPTSKRLPARLSFAVEASAPVVVNASAAQVAVGPSWYVVKPGQAHLAIFNPQNQSSNLDLRFVGSDTPLSEQVYLKPHHSFSFSSHNAKAVVIVSSTAVVASYSGGSRRLIPAQSQPAQRIAVEAVGSSTSVALYNPTDQDAHVTLTVHGGGSSKTQVVAVPPSKVVATRVRKQDGAPEGVVVTSDVPVVASAAP